MIDIPKYSTYASGCLVITYLLCVEAWSLMPVVKRKEVVVKKKNFGLHKTLLWVMALVMGEWMLLCSILYLGHIFDK